MLDLYFYTLIDLIGHRFCCLHVNNTKWINIAKEIAKIHVNNVILDKKWNHNNNKTNKQTQKALS